MHTKLNSMACLREGLLATTHTSSSSATLLVQRHTLSVSRSPRRGALRREGLKMPNDYKAAGLWESGATKSTGNARLASGWL